MAYLAGAEGSWVVRPELFAEVAGFVKPEGMEYEIPKERRQKKGRWVEDDEEPAPKPGFNPDGTRMVNFMATQSPSRTASQEFLAGPSGSNNAGKKREGKGGAASAAANAVRSAAPKKGGFMDRMAERAAFGVTKMANTLGEVDFDEGMEAAKKMGNRAVVSGLGAMGGPAGGGKPGQAAQNDSLLAKSQARALERRKQATQSKDPVQRMRSAEEERRNEEAIERMALKRQNRSNTNLKRGADAGNFVKKSGGAERTNSLGAGNEGLATRGVEKVLGKMGGGVGNKLLSKLEAVV